MTLNNTARLRAVAIIALVLAVSGFFGSQLLFAGHKKNTATPLVTQSLYWYAVDAEENETVGAFLHQGEKAAIVATQSCKDVAGKPICLFGSPNAALPSGTDIGTPSESNRILRNN